MIHLLIIILDDIKCMPDLLQAWRDIGISGGTILKSAGTYRAMSWLSRVGMGAIDGLFESKEVQRRTLLIAIENDELLSQAIAEAERVVGGFDRPHSGLLLVLPVVQVKGIQKVYPKLQQETPPQSLRPGWKMLRDTPIEEVDAVLNLEPTIIRADATLDEVAEAMLAHPNVHIACVVAGDGRLIGIISLQVLADDLFVHVLPEEFLSEITDIEKMIAFANKTRARTAADAMIPPVWVKHGETVMDAFKRMHENGLPGLPVVDEHYKVKCYINLLELLAICLKKGYGVDSMEESQ